MISFDRRTRRVLRRIYWSDRRGITWAELSRLYGDDASVFLLESLTKELYIVTKCGDELVSEFGFRFVRDPESLRAFITPKGRDLLERASFDFWKFIIPLLISVVSLLVSLAGLRAGQ